jgi:hypothetical protein
VRGNLIIRLALGAVLALGGAFTAPGVAAADTPLPVPTNVQVQHVSDTAADLSWNSSGLTDGDVVQRQVNGNWQQYASGLFGWLSLTDLSPATTYTFRVFSTAFPGDGQTDSPPSQPVSFTTMSGPDVTPPSTPPAPAASSITTTMANLFWGAATDNVQVTGYFLQELGSGGWTTIRTVGPSDTDRFQTVTGLTANTAYSFAVSAFDARGNTSPRSTAGTFTTLANTATPTCRVQIVTFPPGFEATVTIINTTTATLNGWTVGFTLPATAGVNNTFSGVLTRNGATGTITPAVWDTTIGQGGQLFTGFYGSASPFTPPSGFTLGGVPCVSG